MTAEIDLYGIYLPALLVWAAIALPLTALLRRALLALGAYRWIWHPALFDFALYLLLLGGVAALAESLSR
ncbi:DUF1656 domain-containing protein [Pseudoroseomonas cervicalis]|uniref:DUF1656 domain-containing protein n=1 Tax=Pseudoroseomonas cervicalis ATCC 49957 TaxID=525371 RepID=D5RLL2_9PROT|nr:DUF1656 domain-containing protein [Pseudoroseomonas cervicalis]EFH11811.1 hypothetical protein HMPREF0731_1973 [Pseudoroseomonas cervicalis ATCC 49957]WBV42923.1 DUF1656 domain-containing protein [Pseudoroseomonas cervicalis]